MTKLTLADAKKRWPEVLAELEKEIRTEFIAELQLKEKFRRTAGVLIKREHEA